MRTKSLFKVISVLLAFSLMLSALPINFINFLGFGASEALEVKNYTGILVNEEGKVTNINNATYTISNGVADPDTKHAHVWLSHSDAKYGRAYLLDVLCTSNENFVIYTKDYVNLAFATNGSDNCIDFTADAELVDDTVFGTSEKIHKITFNVDGVEQIKSIAKLLITVTDAKKVIADEEILAFQYGEGEISIVKFPSTGLKCAPVSDIIVTTEEDGIVSFTNKDDIDISIDVSSMDAPFSAHIFDGDVTSVSVEGLPFDDAISAIEEYAKENGIKKSQLIKFSAKTYKFSNNLFRADKNNTYTIVLSDGYGHTTLKVVKTVRETDRATIKLGIKSNDTFLPITSDKNNQQIQSITHLFLTKDGEGSLLEYEIPSIAGYVFKEVSVGSVSNNVLTHTLHGDTEIEIIYEAQNPGLSLEASTSTTVITPTNDLNKGDNHSFSINIDALGNTGNVDFVNNSVTIAIPQKDKNDIDLELSDLKLFTGTYTGCKNDSKFSVYQTVNGIETLVKSDISVSESETLTIDLKATSIRIDFGNTFIAGTTVATTPKLTGVLNYNGSDSDFNIDFTFNHTATYLDHANTEQTLSDNDTVSIEISNPIYTLTIKHINLSDNKNEVIKTEIVKPFQVYDKIDIPVNYPTIYKYKYNNSTGLDLLESYDSDNGIAFMPNKDLEIVHYYYEKKPYIVDAQLTALYDSVYKNDKQTFFFNSLGACLNNDTQEGNVPMYGYDLVFSLPSNFVAKSIKLPKFDGKKVEVAIFYRYTGNTSWTELKVDDAGQTIKISSQEESTISISNMYSDGYGDLEIKVSYGNSSFSLSNDFRAQTGGEINGSIISDTSNEAKVTLVTATTYPLEDETGKVTDAIHSKSTSHTVRVFQPSIADVTNSANLTTVKGDLYTYNFSNILNDGTANLKDLTFKYTLSDDTYIDTIEVPSFTGKTGEYDIVLKDSNNTVLHTTKGNFENGTIFLNNSSYMNVKTVEVLLGDVDTTFKCNGKLSITLYSTWDDTADVEKTLVGNGKLSATWVSNNDANNSQNLVKTFKTTTTVHDFNDLTSKTDASETVVLNGQKLNFTTNSIENKNTVDVFNFNATIASSDNSHIVSATTGAFTYTTKFVNAKLIILAYDVDGNITEVFNDIIPTVDGTLTLPTNTVKLEYYLPILPAGITTATSPQLTFSMNATVEAEISENITYNVGTFVTDDFSIKVEDVSDIGNAKTASSVHTVAVGKASSVSPTFKTEGTGYFTDTIKHSISGFKNNGNINLYNNTFVFTASEFETFSKINIGVWNNNVSGNVSYVTFASSLAALEGQNPFIELTKFNDVKELEDLEIPVIENDIILAVCVTINVATPDTELLSPVYCTTTLLQDVVKPKDIVSTEMAFGSYYGIVKDVDNITDEEFGKFTEHGVVNEKTELTVIKPAVSFPIATVSSDKVAYRGQFEYTISNIKNTGNTSLTNFELVNAFSPSVRLVFFKTPVFNDFSTYSIYYRVNNNNDWILLQEEVNGRESIEVYIPELNAGEYITDIKFAFDGEIKEDFASTSDLVFSCINWSDAYSIDDIVNNVEVNGVNAETTVSGRYMVSYTPEIPSILKAGFEVKHPEKIFPNQNLELKYTNIKNSTEAVISQYSLTQMISEEFNVVGLYTGSYEKGFSSDTIKVLYRTNLSNEGEWFLLTDEVNIETNEYLEFPELEENEYITCISLKFGDTTGGFAEIESPVIILSPTEKLTNSSEYSLEASLVGVLDGKSFGEVSELKFTTDFGFVNVTAKDEKGNVLSTYKVYGNVGDTFTLEEVALKGYNTISSEGDVTGTFVLGESGNATFICKEVPKTGIEIVTSWNFIAGATLLMIVGIVSLLPDKKKKNNLV